MILGVAIGSVPISPQAVLRVIADHLAGHPRYSVADAIVWEIRLPRVLLAALVGATLATAGTVVQVLVRNALADPFLLGVSSGASVGATAVLLFGAFASLGAWAISAGSVLGALGAMGAVFLVSRQGRALSPTQLILCGVVLSALFESVTSFLIFRGNPQATQAVLFWLLGSFGLATWPQLPIPAIVLAAAMAYLLSQGRSLNALALGPGPAAALGVDLHQLRRNLFIVTSLMAGVAVAVSGVIGFVGLVVPHIVRLMVGSEHRRVLPIGMLFGASFMVLERPARPGDRRAAGNADRRDHRVHRRTTADRAHPTPAVPVRGHRMSLELRDLCVDIARPAHRHRHRPHRSRRDLRRAAGTERQREVHHPQSHLPGPPAGRRPGAHGRARPAGHAAPGRRPADRRGRPGIHPRIRLHRRRDWS